MRHSTAAALLVVTLTAPVLALSAAPSSAAGESFKVISVEATGCNSGNFSMTVLRSNLDGGTYTVRTVATANDLVYMNENATVSVAGASGWSLFNNFSYGAVPNPGTWPIPEDTQLRLDFTLERPLGTVLYEWSTVVTSCNEGAIIYNGPPGEDGDDNFVATPRDKCPGLPATTLDGCPLRTLTLAYDAPRKRLVGWLVTQGYPALSSGKRVTVWRVKPGPDRKLVTLRTSNAGYYSLAKPSKGNYYATAAKLTDPGVYTLAKVTSRTVSVPRR